MKKALLIVIALFTCHFAQAQNGQTVLNGSFISSATDNNPRDDSGPYCLASISGQIEEWYQKNRDTAADEHSVPHYTTRNVFDELSRPVLHIGIGERIYLFSNRYDPGGNVLRKSQLTLRKEGSDWCADLTVRMTRHDVDSIVTVMLKK